METVKEIGQQIKPSETRKKTKTLNHTERLITIQILQRQRRRRRKQKMTRLQQLKKN